jgi:hypothetical protein
MHLHERCSLMAGTQTALQSHPVHRGGRSRSRLIMFIAVPVQQLRAKVVLVSRFVFA